MSNGTLQAEDIPCVVCPVCRGALTTESECLRCSVCGRRYPVVDGIALLLSAGAF